MKHSNSTPIYLNLTGQTANPLIKALGAGHGLAKRQSTALPTGTWLVLEHNHVILDYIADDLIRAPGTPCANGACCGMNGLCGYLPLECSAATCLSDCSAKADCGEYALATSSSCPLNVCCSFFGFCGTTDVSRLLMLKRWYRYWLGLLYRDRYSTWPSWLWLMWRRYQTFMLYYRQRKCTNYWLLRILVRLLSAQLLTTTSDIY